MERLIRGVLRLCWLSRILAFSQYLLTEKEPEVLQNESIRDTRAANRQYHQSHHARFASPRHSASQSVHAVARQKWPRTDGCRHPSPGAALRSCLYNAPGRTENERWLRNPAHLWQAGRLVSQRAGGWWLYDKIGRASCRERV